ncbi:MAG: hypothetical protein Q8919_05285, partial [Bacteroidota bacterium]|nr:hypothetical protein [Bacteroidota bacterium]
MNKSRIFPNAALLCIALVCLSSQGFSQRFEAPDGATIVGRRIFFEGKVMWRNTWTRKCAYASYYGPDLNHPEKKEWHVTDAQYCAPGDLTIVDNLNVEKGSTSYNIYVLSDGSVRGPGNNIYGTIDLSTNESPAKLFGDALYFVTSQNIFISRDTAKTWVIDTTGLGGTVQDAAIDSNQFVYAITYKGLFRQHPDSNIWHEMTTLPSGVVPNKIFIDRLNRMYLAAHLNGTPTLYRSLDAANWLQHTSGMGNAIIFGFGDDSYGNIYAITATNAITGGGNHIFRSNGGSWVSIDIPLIAGNNDSLYVKNIFTGIGGDSVLIATSAYGVFSSTDQGSTWSESNAGIPADQVFGLVRLPSNRFVASTSLGIFGKNLGDTLWQKTFPQSGYLGSQPLFRDSNGSLYTLGPLVAAASINTNYPRLVMKSTDGGSSWVPDTLGISSVGGNSAFTFFVDETGTQHLASYGPGGAPSTIFVKLPGGHWEGDS